MYQWQYNNPLKGSSLLLNAAESVLYNAIFNFSNEILMQLMCACILCDMKADCLDLTHKIYPLIIVYNIFFVNRKYNVHDPMLILIVMVHIEKNSTEIRRATLFYRLSNVCLMQ